MTLYELSQSLLHAAAKDNDKDTIDSLIDSGVAVDGKDELGNTALHIALKTQNFELAEHLISSLGANVNARNNTQKTPLLLAIQVGNLKIVRFLMSQGASIDDTDRSNRQAIHFAANNKNIEVLEYVLALKDNINARDSMEKTALMYAYEKGNIEAATFLISEGASIYDEDKHGTKVIHYAAKGGDIRSLKYLLRKEHIHPNLENKEGSIVPFSAINHKKALKYLLTLPKVNIDINKRGKRGNTLLHLAAARKGYLEIIQLLCRLGANVDIKNDDNKTAYEIAFQRQWTRDIATYLWICERQVARNFDNAHAYSNQLKWRCNFHLFVLPERLPQTLERADEMKTMLERRNSL